MPLSTVLAVSGVLATIIFGAWAVVLAIRHRYPGQITFVSEQTLALFDEIVRNLPDLTVLHKNTPVSPHVVLLKAAFVNTGRKDIAPSMVERPLSLHLPDDCKWLGATIIGASRDVVATFDQPDNPTLVVTTHLLRCKEFIRFQALAEVPTVPAEKDAPHGDTSEHRFEESLRFEHRIQDTQAVRQMELHDTRHLKRRITFYLALPLAGVLLGGAMIAVYLWSGANKEFAYTLRDGQHRVVAVIAHPRRDSVISVRALDGSYKEEISADAFFSRVSGMPTIVDSNRELVLMITAVLVLYVLLPLLLGLMRYQQYRADRRLRTVLGIE